MSLYFNKSSASLVPTLIAESQSPSFDWSVV